MILIFGKIFNGILWGYFGRFLDVIKEGEMVNIFYIKLEIFYIRGFSIIDLNL